MPFTHRLRVRWSEVDLQKVVFFARYAEYCDLAFTEFMREVGLPDPIVQQAEGRELFLRQTTVEYLSPARYDDWLLISVSIERIGRSSLTVRFDIAREQANQALARAAFVYVYADPATGQSVPLPEGWRRKLAAGDRFLESRVG
ncbi:MAG: acyl-CoA thioesterase [Casimicrobiaceae bacterium]|nr:acyl-CoA thioesterase [Casimicrobiaceae bacterium]MCX8097871.1 acyl-CoA thioesterase [Casimicrobiaceae bacterium]MDW8311338.1 thioesterase family protein [Burkholderiales bacterium]